VPVVITRRPAAWAASIAPRALRPAGV
jgi:hypothetical protein